jgi:excisionase family DNA binding protein
MRTNKSKKNHGTEIGVEEAANILSVSNRSIINYINAKKIKAVKVGKKYFVYKPSLEAFAKDSGFKLKRNTKPKYEGSIHKLVSYRLMIEYLQMPLNLYIKKNSLKDFEILKINELNYSALEALGSGFYSYSREKLYHYQRARSFIGGILAILNSSTHFTKTWKNEMNFLENELIPAITSIIKLQERNLSQS